MQRLNWSLSLSLSCVFLMFDRPEVRGAEPTKVAVAPTDEKPTDEKPIVLQVGDKAPLFKANTDEDKLWESAKHVGKKFVVVYFYPADMTPGCTAQACSYRDVLANLDRDDIEVVGVSGDSVANHQHFKRAHKLNFSLLADPEGKIARAFGVKTGDGGAIKRPVEGQEIEFVRGVTSARWTFVIGMDGRIAHIDREVKPDEDSARVLKAIASLAGSKSKP